MGTVTTPLYDAFSADYDRFVRWDRRLAHELPFVEAQLSAVQARHVLDVACGTGQHAIALAERGYEVVGADVSAGMVAQARKNAEVRGTDLDFVQAGFGEVAAAVEDTFDAVLCLGNSLPHVLTPDALVQAVGDMAAVLSPGGLLFVQIRNFDRVIEERNRWMPPQSHREGEDEWLFLRFYDFEPHGTLAFNVVTLHRRGAEEWQQHVEVTRLQPWRQADLLDVVHKAGLTGVRCWGDMSGAAYAPGSPNIVITATKHRAA
jgi:SAM-dependent methyltransferase